MSTYKQIIIIRKDLNMRKGKMCAQASHAAMGFISRQYPSEVEYSLVEMKWFESGTAKIVCQVENLEELQKIVEQAKNAKIKTYVVTDSGLTEFGGTLTVTAAALGPDTSQKLDPITQHLKLF
jgi:peptidyl-tRNA hydrolase, PTH2 family